MQWETFETASKLRYRLPVMRRRIAEAERWLQLFFVRSSHPCVSFSGGKDSLVALDMALRLFPGLGVVWHDEGWYIPGTEETMQAVSILYDIHITRVHRWPLSGHWLRRYGVEPRCSHLKPAEFDGHSWREIYEHFGWDGAIVSMRAEESSIRAHVLKHPLQFLESQQVWRVSPLHNWSVFDVWAYIIGKRLPYHPAYIALIEAGIPPQHARIGPLTAERVYQYGILSVLKHLYPDVWNRFVAENPCVAGEG